MELIFAPTVFEFPLMKGAYPEVIHQRVHIERKGQRQETKVCLLHFAGSQRYNQQDNDPLCGILRTAWIDALILKKVFKIRIIKKEKLEQMNV